MMYIHIGESFGEPACLVKLKQPDGAVFQSDNVEEITQFCQKYMNDRIGYASFDIVFHTTKGDIPITIQEMSISRFSKSPLVGVVADQIAELIKQADR